MKYEDLTDEQKLQVKQDYLIRLSDMGCFIKTVYGEDCEDEERSPSWYELSMAGSIVSEDMIPKDVEYYPEDFC